MKKKNKYEKLTLKYCAIITFTLLTMISKEKKEKTMNWQQ